MNFIPSFLRPKEIKPKNNPFSKTEPTWIETQEPSGQEKISTKLEAIKYLERHTDQLAQATTLEDFFAVLEKLKFVPFAGGFEIEAEKIKEKAFNCVRERRFFSLNQREAEGLPNLGELISHLVENRIALETSEEETSHSVASVPTLTEAIATPVTESFAPVSLAYTPKERADVEAHFMAKEYLNSVTSENAPVIPETEIPISGETVLLDRVPTPPTNTTEEGENAIFNGIDGIHIRQAAHEAAIEKNIQGILQDFENNHPYTPQPTHEETIVEALKSLPEEPKPIPASIGSIETTETIPVPRKQRHGYTDHLVRDSVATLQEVLAQQPTTTTSNKPLRPVLKVAKKSIFERASDFVSSEAAVLEFGFDALRTKVKNNVLRSPLLKKIAARLTKQNTPEKKKISPQEESTSVLRPKTIEEPTSRKQASPEQIAKAKEALQKISNNTESLFAKAQRNLKGAQEVILKSVTYVGERFNSLPKKVKYPVAILIAAIGATGAPATVPALALVTAYRAASGAGLYTMLHKGLEKHYEKLEKTGVSVSVLRKNVMHAGVIGIAAFGGYAFGQYINNLLTPETVSAASGAVSTTIDHSTQAAHETVSAATSIQETVTTTPEVTTHITAPSSTEVLQGALAEALPNVHTFKEGETLWGVVKEHLLATDSFKNLSDQAKNLEISKHIAAIHKAGMLRDINNVRPGDTFTFVDNVPENILEKVNPFSRLVKP